MTITIATKASSPTMVSCARVVVAVMMTIIAVVVVLLCLNNTSMIIIIYWERDQIVGQYLSVITLKIYYTVFWISNTNMIRLK